MRFFIALEIPNESKDEFTLVQRQINELLPGFHLTELDKLHLTIAFIGEQDESLKEELIKILADAVEGIPPFSITPAYIDGFPNLHHPHTLWVGVKGDIDKLLVLRERVRDGLAKLKLETDDRRFIPHIAIGKTRQYEINEKIEKKLQELMLNQEFPPIEVTSIKLFESVPDNGLHTHNTLAKVLLTG